MTRDATRDETVFAQVFESSSDVERPFWTTPSCRRQLAVGVGRTDLSQT